MINTIDFDNSCKLLNINFNSTTDIDTIKKAYRKLSIKYHPDKTNNTTNDLYNKITDAYQYLYQYINNNNNINNNIDNNSDTKNINENKSYNYSIIDYNQECQSNLNTNYISLKQDIELEHNISFNDSYSGNNIPIIIQRTIVKNNVVKQEIETLYIKIPKGIDDNEIIVIKNKGNIVDNYLSNLKIKIKLLPHEYFTREGLDLIYYTNLSFKESLIGYTISFKHLNNKDYKIVNNDGKIIHNNTSFVLQNMGFERDEFIGKLIIKFNINYPKTLPKSTLEKISALL